MEKTCLLCQQPITGKRANFPKTKFCSEKCARLDKNRRFRANASESWKLGRKEYNRQYRLNIRETVLNAYGNVCCCCSEWRSQFLAIDHIDNKGYEHRKNVRCGIFYQWLIDNNFPKDNYQILCHNCNSAKSLYGICPHETERLKASNG